MPILIQITYSPTYLSAEIDDIHAIYNGGNNTVGGSCYVAHQAVSKYGEHLINMVICVDLKLQLVYLGTLIRRLNVSL